jgi:hypothetical protein
MENIKTEIHGEMDSTKVSANTMVRATGWVNVVSAPGTVRLASRRSFEHERQRMRRHLETIVQ